MAILEQRQKQVYRKGKERFDMACDKASLSGSVSQRACVFCGSRVVLYPVSDALHLVHGPAGCASYTWDIRGALSSGTQQLHRLSFSTDLREKDVIYGGENKLYNALSELIDEYAPRAAFVYSTCIVGIIGDDVESVCKKVGMEKGIPVIAVQSEGFKGTKKDGYRAACEALAKLVGTGTSGNIPHLSLNILGDFNIAGETWIIKKYYERMGIRVVASITGDGRVDDIKNAHRASLNVVQCSGSMIHLAEMMKQKYGIPFLRVSYFGLEDMAKALYDVAEFFNDPVVMKKTAGLVREQVDAVYPRLLDYRAALGGRKAAIYVGGAFKAFSLIRALRLLGMETAMVGTQTGDRQDYQRMKELCDEGTVIVDDSNPVELAGFLVEKHVDILIGGVKERPIAYKLGIGFCDHNHERKIALAGFEGMINFAGEVYATVMSPVWKFKLRKPAAMPDDIYREPLFI
ncbi:MAG: nitrogenase iron-molybdenum cofactor biosynthesis protein NifE [Elusimicrobia bacterium RIFOXYB2_FULL_50_12]|nr:MAG: nitrogenase iron-molybdenum cofactor biosynthesis protein NifE [Elusimicrobia bacterium RIFOXYB2_FULL_50_12]